MDNRPSKFMTDLSSSIAKESFICMRYDGADLAHMYLIFFYTGNKAVVFYGSAYRTWRSCQGIVGDDEYDAFFKTFVIRMFYAGAHTVHVVPRSELGNGEWGWVDMGDVNAMEGYGREDMLERMMPIKVGWLPGNIATDWSQDKVQEATVKEDEDA